MTRRHRHRLSSKKAGLPPGTLVATAPPGEPCAGISQVLYDAAGYAGREVQTIEEAFRAPGDRRVLWINVDGVHQLPVLERIGARFGLHPLLLEDIAHTEQRPKLEHYGEHLFMDLNAIRAVEGMEEIQTEQISLVLGPDWLLSFNEAPQPYVAAIRERLRTDKAHARQGGADFLAYTILDAVVDGYYSVLEHVADRVEVLEEELMARPTPATLQAVYGL